MGYDEFMELATAKAMSVDRLDRQLVGLGVVEPKPRGARP